MNEKVNRREFVKAGAAAVAAAGITGCATAGAGAGKLAILGGTPVVAKPEAAEFVGLFKWPIVNEAMRKADDAMEQSMNAFKGGLNLPF